MFKKMLAALGVVAALTLPGAVSTEAKAPLYGEMDLQFNLAWPGPSETIPDWVGTITIAGTEYGMAFFNTGTGKPFDEQPAGNVFFEENWAIYRTLTFSFDTDGKLSTFEPGDTVLAGYDRGITTVKNSKYHMNGDVRTAEDEFEMWMGRSVHMMGDIVWYPFAAPQYAPGTFRIN
jgi:hypothetical protein